MALLIDSALTALKLWVDKSYGHTKIINKFSFSLHRVELDTITPITNFVRNFNVLIPGRDEWQENNILNSYNSTFFTDGSKTDYGCGAGVFSAIHRSRLSYKLPNECSIFQCEIFAIRMACETIKAIGTVGSSIAICVDSRAALLALKSDTIKSAVVKDCLSIVNEVGRVNRLDLIWVPGHSNIDGNEAEDLLARQGSSLHPSWITKIPIPLCVFGLKAKEEMKFRCNRRWAFTDSCYDTKELLPQWDEKFSDKVCKLNRSTLKKIIFCFTGHWPLGTHSIRLGIRVPGTCPSCGTSAEEIKTDHFWCHCPALTTNRMKYLGQRFFQDLRELNDINVKSKIE
ncbi:ribonuclease H family protein [Streptomyces sp. IBSBF 2390]|uniref:ribonuclease H family protein n=1 Tax=Streptomyces sp. IBSBF 2390 TaxID=2903533 RepID=UPI002FDC167F